MSNVPVVLYINGIASYGTTATKSGNNYVYNITELTSNTNYSIYLNYSSNGQISQNS